MAEPLTADERAALRAICETWERPSLASAVVLRLLDEREALAVALEAMLHCRRPGAFCAGCPWADADGMGMGRGDCAARARRLAEGR